MSLESLLSILLHLLTAHTRAVVITLVIVIVCLTLLQGWWPPGKRIREFRAAMARQRSIAERLGIRAPGTDQNQSLLRNTLESMVNGTERFGPFLRFRTHESVRLLFEGEKDGIRMAIFTHGIPSSSADGPPESPTTLICLFLPDTDLVPTLKLSPAAAAAPAPIEAAAKLAARVLAPLAGPNYPEVDLSEYPGFQAVYQLRSESPDAARQVFDTRLTGFLERNPGWTIEVMDGRLLLCREHIEEPLDRMEGFVSEAERIAEAFRLGPHHRRS